MEIKTFELKVMKYVDQMIFKGDHVLMAVSGGPDSVCLMTLLSKWANLHQWSLKVVYVDHGLRSRAHFERKFVKKLTEDLGIPFSGVRGSSLHIKNKFKVSTEEAARELRHNALRAEAQKFNNAKIALAHHLDDQVETFFIQLFKGSGLGGISGMKAKEGNIVRPLLCVTKGEILEYLKAKKISYLKDETNDSAEFLRNKVRLKLLPYIKRHFSEWNIHKTLPKMMNIFKDEHEFLNVLSDEFFTRGTEEVFLSRSKAQPERRAMRQKKTSAVPRALELESFKSLPIALQRRIIKSILDRFSSQRNYSATHIEENRKLFYNPHSHKKLMLPEGIRVEKLKKSVFFSQII